MKAFVRPATAADADGICTLLHTKMNARIPIEQWRQLTNYRWLDEKPDFGRVVESDGQVLGYCGMVYADRWIGDAQRGMRRERIVSMSSWYLDKSLRGQGLGKKMLVSAVDNPELTYVTLTNSRKPLGIVEAIGFKVLEDHRYEWRKTGQNDPKPTGLDLVDDVSVIRDRVAPYQRTLIDDMRNYPLSPCLIETPDSSLLLFLSIKPKGEDVLWFDVMYSSDTSLLRRHAQGIANLLLPDSPSVFAADGRFIGTQPADGVRVQLPVGRYFYGNRVAAEHIDHLYSELQLLDLKLD